MNNGSAQAKFTFTPGVNGDYANPQALYKVLSYEDSQDFQIKQGNLEFECMDQLADDGEYKNHPEANITCYGFDYYENQQNNVSVVLDGVNIEMKCIGNDCNSEGIWPFHFEFGVHKINHNSTHFGVQAKIKMHRGWTPSHGGGRPLNQNMKYIAKIPYKMIISNQVIIEQNTIKTQSDLHSEKFIQSNVDYQDKENYPVVLPAFNNIKFQLDSKKENQGRYIEKFAFVINQSDNTINILNQLNGPKTTTFESVVSFESEYQIFYLHQNLNATISKTNAVSGKVCVDDWVMLFWCKNKGLRNQTIDVVKFDY